MSYIAERMGTIYRLMYRYIYLNILKLGNSIMHVFAPRHTCSVAIIDDLSPHPTGAFRSSEFSWLMQRIPGAYLFNTLATKVSKRKQYRYFTTFSVAEFNKNKSLFSKEFNIEGRRIQPFFPWTKIDTKLAYIAFLHNAYYMIDYLEENNIKFILELYPGGGFTVLTEGPGYEMLKRVLSSPCLVTVFVTMKLSNRFLREQKLCDESKITYFYGGILSPKLFGLPAKTIKYPYNKNTIDICFVASKYTPQGLDKGYDIFIDMAHMLLAQKDIFRFHVVGGFVAEDIPIDPAYKHCFSFYGYLDSSVFAEFYKDKDIFVSPTRPFMIAKGAFDGFPTGTCAEAGLNGLCMMLSDPLDMNEGFVNYEDIVILENDPKQFADAILKLSDTPDEIYRIGNNSKIGIELDPPERQLSFRVSLIEKYMAQNN